MINLFITHVRLEIPPTTQHEFLTLNDFEFAKQNLNNNFFYIFQLKKQFKQER